jgi:hypothetical protein
MFIYIFIIFSLLLTSLHVSAQSLSQLQPTLLPPESSTYRKAGDVLRIQFPQDALSNLNTQLALEIDTVDVSSMVAIEGDQLVFTPPSPLVLGSHEIRLVEYAANGDIIELGSWSFEVRQSVAFREQQLSIGAVINNRYRTADNFSDSDFEIEKYRSDGAAEITYIAKNKNSAVNFNASLLYDEDENNTIRGEQVDLGQYLLGIDLGENTHIDIGHHSVQHSSLIYNQFHRRGISGNFKLPSVNSVLRVFSSRTGDLQGFTEGLGVEDSDNRVDGIALDYQPFSANPESLTIITSYLTGARKDEDDTIGMLVEESNGDAASIAIDSRVFNQTLHIHIEAAQSRFDFDGDGDNLDAETDNAYSFFTRYSPQPNSNSETPFIWDISLEKAIVEPNFFSLSNDYLAADRDFTKLSSNINKGNVSAQTFVSFEEDNLDDRFTSTNNTLYGGAFVSYVQNTGSNSWFGSPQYTLTYLYIKNDQDDPVGASTNNNTNESIELGSQFSYDKGSWSVGVLESKFNDDTGFISDNKINIYRIDGSYSINNYNSVSAGISAENTKEIDLNLDAERIIYTMSFDHLSPAYNTNAYLRLHYEELDDETFGPPDETTDTITIEASIGKRLLEAKNLFPGINVSLNGTYREAEDKAVLDNDARDYAVFLNLDFYWDVNKP